MFREVRVGEFNLKFFRLEGNYNTYQCIEIDKRFVSDNAFKKHSFEASNGYVVSFKNDIVGISDERVYVGNKIEPVIFEADSEEFVSIIIKVRFAIAELHEDLKKEGAFKTNMFEGKGRCTQF